MKLTGKEVVAKMTEQGLQDVKDLLLAGVSPCLAILRVGQNPDDMAYERSAIKKSAALGITCESIVLPEDACFELIKNAILSINSNPLIHGCLMLRPLPKNINEQAICDLLDPTKDIDGISTASLGAVFMDKDYGYAPCTAGACIQMLDHYNIVPKGKNVVVVGRSLVIGKPVAAMLLRRHATVTTCHSASQDLPDIMKTADIVICATGRPKAYTAQCFSPGQVVLDVGINFTEEGMCGDVDYESVSPIVDSITPVPGGLGAVTTAVLLSNLLDAAKKSIQ